MNEKDRNSGDNPGAGERRMKRIAWVDYAKSFAILCIVPLHAHFDPTLDWIIKSFIMPLFFIISGRLFSYERNPDYGKFVLKRFRQLVVPYLWIGALSYLYWLFIWKAGTSTHSGYEWYHPLMGQLAGIPKYYFHNAPLWSFLAFFVIEILYYPLGRLRNGIYAAMAAGVSLMAISHYLIGDAMPFVPLVAGPSVIGLFFYGIGQLWRIHEKSVGGLFHPLTLLIWLPIYILALSSNGWIHYYICDFGNSMWLFLAESISGSAIVIILSMCAGRLGDFGIVRFISVNTLLICGFHMLAFSLIKGIGLYLFGIAPAEFTSDILRGACFSAVGFLLTLPVCLIVNRWMPFLVAKKMPA